MTLTLTQTTQTLFSHDCADGLTALLRDISDLSEKVGAEGFMGELTRLINKWVPSESLAVFEFTRGMQPQYLHGEGNVPDAEMVEYLSGIYLIDPLYELFERDNKFGVYRLNQETEENWNESTSFKRFWKKVAGRDEIGTLMPLPDGNCVHLSVFLALGAQETETAMRFFKVCHDTFTRLLARHFMPTANAASRHLHARRHVHQTVSRILAEFGDGALTLREKEVSHLLLKGHSAKSIARILDISPGTAAIHRSNVYKKLGVSGQGDMFALFMARLANA